MSNFVLDEAKNEFSANYLFSVFIEQIKNRPILEGKSGSLCDKILAGYLQVTQSLIEAVDKDGSARDSLKVIGGSESS